MTQKQLEIKKVIGRGIDLIRELIKPKQDVKRQ
jgi:hypothetical protein